MISAVKSFYFLEEHDALGGLEKVGTMLDKMCIRDRFKVRCMVAEHMARAPLGALNERRTGDIKTVLNEDIEKLEDVYKRQLQYCSNLSHSFVAICFP